MTVLWGVWAVKFMLQMYICNNNWYLVVMGQIGIRGACASVCTCVREHLQ